MRFTSFFYTPSLYFLHKSFLIQIFGSQNIFPSDRIYCAPFSSLTQMNPFNNEHFQSCINDFETPDLEGWNFVAECDGLKIYKQLATVSANKSLYKYKVIGVLKGIEASVAYSVYMDLDYRRKWDNLNSDQLRIRPLPSQFPKVSDLECIYWRVKFPMLLSDRDYVFLRQGKRLKTRTDHPCYVVVAEAFPDSDEPLVKGVIRVTEYNQTILFAPSTRNESDETQIHMVYFDNPGGNIPSAVINWAVSNGVPTFLSKLKRACEQYQLLSSPKSS